MRTLQIIAFVLPLIFSGEIFAANGAEASWKELTGLVGTWRIAEPKTPSQEAFRISYRLISRDTVLVESFGDPAKQVTETLYHMDGDRLLATHYCAQGNQPRLYLKKTAEDPALSFEFLDATNLKSADDPHLVRMKFGTSGQRLVRHEVYAENGKETASTLTLERTP